MKTEALVLTDLSLKVERELSLCGSLLYRISYWLVVGVTRCMSEIGGSQRV